LQFHLENLGAELLIHVFRDVFRVPFLGSLNVH
jgi:hypothetical protein